MRTLENMRDNTEPTPVDITTETLPLTFLEE